MDHSSFAADVNPSHGDSVRGWQESKAAIGAPEPHHYDPPLAQQPRVGGAEPQSVGICSNRVGDAPDSLPVVLLPGGDVTNLWTAEQLGELMAKTGRHFVRGGVTVSLEQDDKGQPHLKSIRPEALPSIFESVAQLCRKDKNNKPVPCTCPVQTARVISNAEPFLDALPTIRVLTKCPVLIERDGKLVQIAGYDRDSGIFAGGEEVPISTSPEDSAAILKDVLGDFSFSTPGDRSRALAALVTPALVFGGLLGGRPPLDLGEADASQSGKGFRNKITAALYGEKVRTVTQRKRGVGGLEEKLDAALVKGSPLISLDNIRGKVDLPALESFLTEDTYLARPSYSTNVEIDPSRVVLMMTSNRAELTVDLANRSSPVRIAKRPEGYEFTHYPEGDILDHVRANQVKILGAVFSIIQAWYAEGKLRTCETGHDFRVWAQQLDWIVQHLLGAAPLLDGLREAKQRMTTPALLWLRDVLLAIRDAGRTGRWLRTHEILDILAEQPDLEIPGVKDGDDIENSEVRDKAYPAIGKRLGSCFRQEPSLFVDGMTVERRKTTDDNSRQAWEYHLLAREDSPPVARQSPAGDPAVKTRVSANPANESKLLVSNHSPYLYELLASHGGTADNGGTADSGETEDVLVI